MLNLGSKTGIHGMAHIYLHDKAGNLYDERHINNLVVSGGEAHVADQMCDQSQTAMTLMAVGSGSTAAASTDTALEAQIEDQHTATKTRTTNVVRYTAQWAAGHATASLYEAGIFNTDGLMLTRVVFEVINKWANDIMTIQWDITYEDA